MFSSNAVFAYPYEDDNAAQMDQHFEHENHDDDTNNEDQQVDAHDDEARTHQLLWQLQLSPSLIAPRAAENTSITCEETDSQTLPSQHQPALPTVTNLMV
jgi:hypothetical protein